MSTTTQEHNSWIKSVLLLLCLSAVSALIIFFGIPAIMRIIMPNCNELSCLFPYVITLGLQWILVIPATMVVLAKFKRDVHYYSWSALHPVICIGIPLILNIIGANSIAIQDYVNRMQQDISNANTLQNVSVTIKEESIIPWSVPNPAVNIHYAYQVVLHIDNHSKEKIPYMAFFMGAFEKNDYEWPYSSPREFASGNLQSAFPVGAFDLTVRMPISGEVLQCGNSSLSKPLYVLYSLVDEYKPIAVSKTINQKLQQLACDVPPS